MFSSWVAVRRDWPRGLRFGSAACAWWWRILRKPPIDKACGEGLMPQTVAALKALGVTLGPSQAVPFRGIRFIGEGRVAEGAFPQGYGLGIRRTTLHQALVERAAEAGVQSLWGTRVRSIGRGEVWLDSGKVQCRWIIGADGQNSLVRKWAGSGSAGTRRKLASGSGSISASRRGQTLWKFIGGAIARSWSLP